MKKIEKGYWSENDGNLRIYHSAEPSSAIIDGRKMAWAHRPFQVVDLRNEDRPSILCKYATQKEAEHFISLAGDKNLLRKEIEKQDLNYFDHIPDSRIDRYLESFAQ